jgi:hypothetical protein
LQVSEHPALGIALAKALRTRSQHRRLPARAAAAAAAGPAEAEAEPSFAVEAHTYVDARNYVTAPAGSIPFKKNLQGCADTQKNERN